MRAFLAALTLGSVALLVVLTSPDRVSTDPTVAMLPDPTTSLAAPGESRIEASLPDGTQFIVTVDPSVSAEWLATTAAIVAEVDGEAFAVGPLSFHRDVPNASYAFEDGSYRLPAAGILVEIELEPAALRRLGPGAEETISRSIKGNSESGYPVLRLRDPFKWASDENSADVMAVRFSSFEVRRGCGLAAVVCSPEKSLQVIWRTHELVSAPPLEQPEVRIFRLVP